MWKHPHALGGAVRHILQGALMANVMILEINRAAHRRSGGRVPLIPPLYSAGVVYREEPRSWEHEHFDALTVVYQKRPSPVIGEPAIRWGDCDDLAPIRAAELRVSGADKRADIMVKWKPMASDPKKTLYHVVVRRSNVSRNRVDGRQFLADERGVYEDPCRVLGMGGAAAARHQGL